MIVVYRITGAQADRMAGLLQSELYEALKEGQDSEDNRRCRKRSYPIAN